MTPLDSFERQFPRLSEVWEATKARPGYDKSRFHAAAYLVFMRKLVRVAGINGKMPESLVSTLDKGFQGIAASLMLPEITGPSGEFQGSLFSMLEKCISGDFLAIIEAKKDQS